jgi:hypothetical protein
MSHQCHQCLQDLRSASPYLKADVPPVPAGSKVRLPLLKADLPPVPTGFKVRLPLLKG